MGKLTREDRETLSYLAKHRQLVWGGVYEKGGDPDIIRLVHQGLVEEVARPYYVGRLCFRGGYRITPAGRLALQQAGETKP